MKPIDPEWVRGYVDQLLTLAERLEPGRLRDAVLLRVEHVLDLVKAWVDRDQ